MRSLGEAIKGHVGASLIAMVVNDGACLQAKRGALGSIASRRSSCKGCVAGERSWIR